MSAGHVRRVGPLPLLAEAEVQTSDLMRPSRASRQAPWRTEMALLVDDIGRAIEQSVYAATHSPDWQVEHWLWVAEGLQRELDALGPLAIADLAPVTERHDQHELVAF